MTTAREISHPLFIPKGSVRAIVTLTVVGACCYRLVLGVPLQQNMALYVGLFLVLSYYFAHRGARRARDADKGARHPLFLPRGAVRTILIAGFVGTGVLMWRQGGLETLKKNWLTVVTILSFFSGVALNVLYRFRRSHPGVKTPLLDLFDHTKAVVVILAAFLLGWSDYVSLEGLMDGHDRQVAALAAIAFYFGSR